MTVDLSALEQQYNLPSGLLSFVQNREDASGNPNAVSSAGAVGPFQFEPETAKAYGISDPTDYDQSAVGAAKMFSDLNNQYNGSIPHMLAAYNWGSGNVDKKGLDAAPKETKNYIEAGLNALGNAVVPSAQAAELSPQAPDPSKMSDEELMMELSRQNLIKPTTQPEDNIDLGYKGNIPSITVRPKGQPVIMPSDPSMFTDEELQAELSKQGLIGASNGMPTTAKQQTEPQPKTSQLPNKPPIDADAELRAGAQNDVNTNPLSALGAYGLNMMQAPTFGWGGTIASGLLAALPNQDLGETYGQRYSNLQKFQQAYREAGENQEGTRIKTPSWMPDITATGIGEIGSTLASLPFLPAPSTIPSGLGGAVWGGAKSGGKYGAIYGAGQGDAFQNDPVANAAIRAKNALVGLGTGAIGGGLMGAGGYAGSKLADLYRETYGSSDNQGLQNFNKTQIEPKETSNANSNAYQTLNGNIPKAQNLSNQDRSIETNFANKVGNNYNAAVKEYANLPETNGGKIINTDSARELSEDYRNDRSKSAAVHEPASWFSKQMYADKLKEAPKNGEDNLVTFTSGGTGAGKSSATKGMKNTLDKSQIIYDTNMNKYDSSVQKIEQALKAGKDVEIFHIHRDPIDALVNGALPRAERMAQKLGTGRTVPLNEHENTHVGSRQVIEKLAKKYDGDDRVRITLIDNSKGQGNQEIIPLDKLPEIDHNNLHEKLKAALDQERASGRISERTYKGFLPQGEKPQNGSGDVGKFALQRSKQGSNQLASSSINFTPAQQRGHAIVGEAFQNSFPKKQNVAQGIRDWADTLEDARNKSGLDLRAIDVATNDSNGLPVVGKDLQGLMLASARMPGGGAQMAGEMASRSQKIPDQVGKIFDDLISKNKFYDISDKADAEGNLSSPLYKEAFKQNQSISSPLIDKILETPAGKDALNGAVEQMQDEMRRVAVPDKDLTEQARDAGIVAKGGVASGLKMQTLDYVKRELDAMARAAFKRAQNGTGTTAEASRYANLAKDLRDEMDKLDVTGKAGPNSLKPEGGMYAQARAKSATKLQMKDALEQGRNALNMDPEEIQRFIEDKNTSDPEKLAFAAGFRRAISDRFRNNPTQVSKLWQDVIRPRIEPLAPNADVLSNADAKIDLVKRMQQNNNFANLAGNSITMPAQQYAGMIEKQPSNVENIIHAVFHPKEAASKGIVGMMSKNVEKSAKNMTSESAAEIQRLLTTSNPQDLRDFATSLEQQAQKPTSILGK